MGEKEKSDYLKTFTIGFLLVTGSKKTKASSFPKSAISKSPGFHFLQSISSEVFHSLFQSVGVTLISKLVLNSTVKSLTDVSHNKTVCI